MDLIDDKYPVIAKLRRNVHLLGEHAYVVDGVIGGSVKLDYIVGVAAVNGAA